MALSKDIYRELEDILGPENVSEDPAILEGYAFTGTYGLVDYNKRFYLRPAAVTLPGCTKDVQAIIKLCNRRGIMCKASSTHMGAHNTSGSEGVIHMDLRRMNRILDIDEKNMIIVVEPYVSFSQVQAEVMKRGLNTNIVGGGAQFSYLASHTSMDGNGSQGISCGYSGRNLLGAEWVLPTGEILQLGSLGSRAGYFSGDGPGPSIRGIVRGYKGACGGLGVFTKCVGHLHPWPGPAQFDIKGNSPFYEMEIPPLCEYHICEFSTWDQFADAVYKIGESGIAYSMNKTGGPGSHGLIVTGSNNDYYEKRLSGRLKIPRISLAIVMVAGSPEEHDYQVKTLNQILEDTGGRFSEVGEDPLMKKRDFINMIKTCFVPRLAFRASGTFFVDGLVGTESLDNCVTGLAKDDSFRDKYADLGIIMDDDTSNAWATAYEGTHMGIIECGHPFSSTDEESCKGMMRMIREGTEIALNTPLSCSWRAVGTGSFGMSTAFIGPLCNNYQVWMSRIKKAFDPNTASDPSTYANPE